VLNRLIRSLTVISLVISGCCPKRNQLPTIKRYRRASPMLTGGGPEIALPFPRSIRSLGFLLLAVLG